MLKRVHKFIIASILTCFLLSPSIVLCEGVVAPPDEISPNNEVESVQDETKVQDEVKVKDLDIEPINTQKVKESVIPDPAKEGKKVIGLFLKTMVAVLICVVLLYFILIFAKRFFPNAFNNNYESEELEDLDLSTPGNKHDALRSFLNRTK